MSKNTKIQWCDSTVNPTMGCDGCELWSKQKKTCYAGILHTRFGGVTKGYAPSFEEITEFPGRMEAAARWPDLTGTQRPDKPWLDWMPRTIFVSDMSDSLSQAVSFEYLRKEIIANVISDDGRRHQWLWLTKRPDRMAQFSDWLTARGILWPPNLWVGTSVTSSSTTNRIDKLLNVGDEHTLRFLSVEPQTERISLEPWLPRLDWVIQGGESGHAARIFEMEWATDLISQCRKHGVAYFLKQLGSLVTRKGRSVTFKDSHASDWSEWPKRLRVRQMPQTRLMGDGEEHEPISAASYLEFILDTLRTCGGVIEAEELAEKVLGAFSPLMSAADHQSVRNRQVPRWKNLVDWAKATGAKKNLLATLKQGKQRYVVLLDADVTDATWLQVVAGVKKHRKPSFQKRCLNCKTYQPLRNKCCKECGVPMPVSTKRRVVLES